MAKIIKGTSDKDLLIGGKFAELIIGYDGDDRLFGNGGADTLQGGNGNDRIDGGTGKDLLEGGDGDDRYYVDSSGDQVLERADKGMDTVYASVSHELSANVERLLLTGTGDIDATGNHLDNVLVGNVGANILDGGTGGDRMSGGEGADTYFVDNAKDQVVEAANGGIDTVIATIAVTLGRDIENLALGGTGDLSGTGNDLRNILTGNDGGNTLDGAAGIDWMRGGKGDDSYFVDNSADKITELLGQGTDGVKSTVSYVLSANVENLTLTGSAAINGTGNALANTLNGNDAPNKLYADDIIGGGNGGGDHLIGAGGNDTLFSGDGSNTLDGGDGSADTADYSHFSTALTVTMDSFESTVTKAAGGIDTLTNIENLRGSSVDDTFSVSNAGSFFGGSGNDTMTDGATDAVAVKLYGESGNDTLTLVGDGGTLDGGANDDVLVASEASAANIRMTGGTGADEFWMAVNVNGSGGALADGTLAAPMTIADFQDGIDHLVFAAFGSVETADDWFALLTSANEVTEEGNEIHIDIDGGVGETVIKGLKLSTFSAADILVIA